MEAAFSIWKIPASVSIGKMLAYYHTCFSHMCRTLLKLVSNSVSVSCSSVAMWQSPMCDVYWKMLWKAKSGRLTLFIPWERMNKINFHWPYCLNQWFYLKAFGSFFIGKLNNLLYEWVPIWTNVVLDRMKRYHPNSYYLQFAYLWLNESIHW